MASSGFNLTTQGLQSQMRIDMAAQRLQQMARIPTQYNPTASRIMAINDQDKQNDENATFIFEYRALLNSRLQQLITKLTNAYTSDLDSAMGSKLATWGSKDAMQGATPEDPGAARVTYAYYSQWTSGAGNEKVTRGGSASTMEAYGDGTTGASTSGESSEFTIENNSSWDDPSGFDSTYVLMNDDLTISRGTSSFQSGSTSDGTTEYLLGSFGVDFYAAAGTDNVTGLENSEFQKALHKALQKRDNFDIMRWGLLGKDGDAIYIASTTTLATGSQIQGTLKLEYIGTGRSGYVTIKQNRWAAFYHS